MSSKNRNFRRKAEDAQQNEEPGLGSPPASILAARKAKEKEKKAVKKISLLSFDEEESLSPVKAIAEAKSKERSKSRVKPNLKGLSTADDRKAASTQQSGAGEYSAERLKELKANAKSFTGPRAPMSSVHSKEEPDPSGGFKLSGSFKPAVPSTEPHTDTLATQKPPKQNGNTMELPPPKIRDTTAELQAAPPLPAEEEDDFHVPSAEMIRLAKQKRERLRSAHLAPDYIPLGGAAGLANLESRLKPEAGLQPTEDGQAGSGSDEDNPHHRMTFIGDTRNGRLLPKTDELADEEEPQSFGGEEEDDDHWVREQIRKGVGGGAPVSQPKGSAAAYAAAAAARPSAYPISAPVTGSRAADNLTNSGEAALKTLQQSLHRLKMTQANIEKQATKTQENMSSSVEAVTRLQNDLDKSSKKYTFLQQLRTYMSDLCDMLQAKSAIVEELEEHLLAASEQRAAALEQRSVGDETVDLEVASAAVSAALGVLSRGGELPAASAAASAATNNAEERLAGTAEHVELDEFGRDVSLEANRDGPKRKLRIDKRNKQWEGDPEGRGGADTSDESDSEERQYKRRRVEVLETAEKVFADADEEFATLGAVKRRLEKWKGAHPDTYANAYASDNVPAIFAPFVRNELLAWDPIYDGGKDFDQQQWYQTLLAYGRNTSAKQAANTEEDELIPTLVMNLVLPLAQHAVQASWNPFSRKHTRRVVKMLELLLVHLPVEDAKMQELMGEVRQRLESSIGLLKLPPWPQAATSAAPNAAAFLAHMYGKALRLLVNIAAFDSLLPRVPLLSMAFERIIQQQLLTYIQGATNDMEAAIKRSERLIAVLPEAWTAPGSSQSQGAKPLTEALARFARVLEGKRKEEAPRNVAFAQRLCRLLSRMGDKDASRGLNSAYRL